MTRPSANVYSRHYKHANHFDAENIRQDEPPCWKMLKTNQQQPPTAQRRKIHHKTECARLHVAIRRQIAPKPSTLLPHPSDTIPRAPSTLSRLSEMYLMPPAVAAPAAASPSKASSAAGQRTQRVVQKSVIFAPRWCSHPREGSTKR